jgi:hypothetical protein
MSADPEPINLAAPDALSAPPGALKPLPKPRKNFGAPPLKKKLGTLMWIVIVLAGAACAGLAILVSQLIVPAVETGPPVLAAPFNDQVNGVSIRPPINWGINDPHDGYNVYFLGQKEKGYSPLIIMTLDITAGRLDAAVKEHKDRTSARDKSVKWLSEEMDVIDSAPAKRLEYEYTYQEQGKPDVTVRGLQFIIADYPRYYRVSGYVQADLYKRYYERFNASLRSFKRLPKPFATPQVEVPAAEKKPDDAASSRARCAWGVVPAARRNTRAKYPGSRNPEAQAISLMLRSGDSIRLLACSIRNSLMCATMVCPVS